MDPTQTYNTVNGQQTTSSMASQLANAGYNGPTDASSIAAAYQRTTGGTVSLIPGGDSTAGGTGIDGGGGGGGSNVANAANNDPIAQNLQSLLNAAAAGNEQAFQQAVTEFNQNYALQQAQTFGTQGTPQNGQQTLAAAEALGNVAGAPTLAKQEAIGNIGGNPTVQEQQQQLAQGEALGNVGGQQTLAAQQQAANIAAQQAGLTGNLYGNPTLQAQAQQAGLTGFTTTSQGPGTIGQGLNWNDISNAGSAAMGRQWVDSQAKQLWSQLTGGQNGSASLSNLSPAQVNAILAAGSGGQLNLNNVSQFLPQGTFTPGQTTQQPTTAYQQQLFSQGLQTTQEAAALQQQQFQQGITQAGTTGLYNGMPTEQARQFNIGEEQNLADLASKLTGPANYYQFLGAQNAGRNIYDQLTQGGAFAQGANGGQVNPQSIGNILGAFSPTGATGQNQGASTGTSTPGAATGVQAAGQPSTAQPGQTYAAGYQSPNTNNGQGLTLPDGTTLPYPNQINYSTWQSMGPSAQQFILGAAGAAGYDPQEYQRQIQLTAPAGSGSDTAPVGGQQFAGAGAAAPGGGGGGGGSAF